MSSKPKPRIQSANTTRPGAMARTSAPSAAAMTMPAHTPCPMAMETPRATPRASTRILRLLSLMGYSVGPVQGVRRQGRYRERSIQVTRIHFQDINRGNHLSCRVRFSPEQGMHRRTVLADFEIEAGAFAARSHGGDGLARLHRVADAFRQRLVITIKTHIAVAVIEYEQ